jgi:hypothetical protein
MQPKGQVEQLAGQVAGIRKNLGRVTKREFNDFTTNRFTKEVHH